ncbi:MAG TPA: class I SAM-dependent methyltransferase, partial [Burkholderiales bacterium]|nr:class I SAM-dependent methyltransferase [Burkholderiales bacterium]
SDCPTGTPRARVSPPCSRTSPRTLSGFTTDWLALREPADELARAGALVKAFVSSPGAALQVVDLGAGTGANLRYLAPRLGGPQEWLEVDSDPTLLGALAARPAPAGTRVRTLRLDLAHDLDALPLDRNDLVTAAALLDLVSATWLARLAARCAAARADVLFALTYDGRIEWSPAEDGDARIRALVNAHQRTDKGFGPALGPAAAAEAERTFARLGYRMRSARSDWRLGTESRALQAALVDGWVGAAIEIAPREANALEDWRRRRRAHLAAGASRLCVGHLDLAGKLRSR